MLCNIYEKQKLFNTLWTGNTILGWKTLQFKENLLCKNVAVGSFSAVAMCTPEETFDLLGGASAW